MNLCNNVDSRYRPMTPHHQTPPPLSMRQHDPLHQMRVMEQQRMAQQPQRPSVIAQPPQSPAVRPTVLSGSVCNKLNFCCNFVAIQLLLQFCETASQDHKLLENNPFMNWAKPQIEKPSFNPPAFNPAPSTVPSLPSKPEEEKAPIRVVAPSLQRER